MHTHLTIRPFLGSFRFSLQGNVRKWFPLMRIPFLLTDNCIEYSMNVDIYFAKHTLLNTPTHAHTGAQTNARGSTYKHLLFSLGKKMFLLQFSSSAFP